MIVVGVESGSRQIIGVIEEQARTGAIMLHNPLMLLEQRTGPTQISIAMAPLLQSYDVDQVYVNLSSIIAIDDDSELARRYTKEWENISMKQRAARAGIVPATGMPGGKHGNGPLITS